MWLHMPAAEGPRRFLGAFALLEVVVESADDQVGQFLLMMEQVLSGKRLMAEGYPSQCHGLVVLVALFVVGRLMNWPLHLEYTMNLQHVILYGFAENSRRWPT
jgi:hypothetical protein